MKQQIDTAPVLEAFEAQEECPFCYLERQAQQSAIRYAAGPCASYMEPDVRYATNQLGFCREHQKQLFDYGNALGSALMLQTRLEHLRSQLQQQRALLEIPERKGLFSKKEEKPMQISQWAAQQEQGCFICNKIAYNMQRYYNTFFHLLNEPEFRQQVENSKGFCLHHFGKLLEQAPKLLKDKHAPWFYTALPKVMEDNLARVQEDLDWFVEKFDYRNASAPWKNSKDAVSRTMQKLRGGYVADPPYKQD